MENAHFRYFSIGIFHEKSHPFFRHPLKVTVAELRQLDSVKALLDLGADVNRPSKTGRSNLRALGADDGIGLF